ncbi:putative remnant of a transposase [Mycobacterium tuberculosis]|nr:putative remnant of a transposase [Mycobacterium tuberculosis]
MALRPENPDRTAGAIQRILRAQLAGDRIALRGRGS